MSEHERLGTPDEVRGAVRQGYARVVEVAAKGGREAAERAGETARRIGYSDEALAAVPEGANLGVGCGNPTALASLRPGEVVLDLGSGAGFDAFLASRAVGPEGRVIGVDMTEAMLEKARANARAGGYDRVEFRRGTIEELPVEDASVDVVISNCVINLSPEKERVFREAHRVLRPGGRLMISDIVLEEALPEELAQSIDAYLGCIGGASVRGEYLKTIEAAGFRDVEIARESRFASAFSPDHPQVVEGAAAIGVTPEEALALLERVTSVHVRARK